MIVTEEEARRRIVELEGWTALPADDPERAMGGVVLFKDDEEERLEWPLFGAPLSPSTKVASNYEEFLDFFEENAPGLALCDSPAQLMLGLAKYNPERGTADICRISLRELKNALVSDSDRAQRLQAFREGFISGSSPGSKLIQQTRAETSNVQIA